MSKDKTEVPVPKGLITPEQAKVLDTAYNSRHTLISEKLLGRPDNRSTWYALENIEAYLVYAKNQAKALGYTLDGIRIYEGAYPAEQKEEGYTTMFIMPTGVSDTCKTKSLKSDPSDSEDIPGGNGLNMGSGGVPPEANYPQ
ncbi:hypothetical protein FNB79_08445 [Formosa sediminum]|uniref:Uncharacterized protein n=1 Tax=Formosa sediminum TaxID=2594004 RepID=A0A516GRL6_9FLAO|nr:hypothetical protein [Formosa sediminum]QDO94010.1 hypothetical protein FNB79_08445 [Formosa sediminum]